jgi:hypothetical protein
VLLRQRRGHHAPANGFKDLRIAASENRLLARIAGTTARVNSIVVLG